VTQTCCFIILYDSDTFAESYSQASSPQNAASVLTVCYPSFNSRASLLTTHLISTVNLPTTNLGCSPAPLLPKSAPSESPVDGSWFYRGTSLIREHPPQQPTGGLPFGGPRGGVLSLMSEVPLNTPLPNSTLSKCLADGYRFSLANI
jgi:hypothetical protein